MSELGIIINSTDERTFSTYVIIISSLMFLAISSYKLLRLLEIYEHNSTSFIILVIHLEIIGIFVFRFAWGIVLHFNLIYWTQILDSLVCVLLTVLGNTFTCLWMDLAFSNNSKYSSNTKQRYTLFVIVCLVLVSFVDLLLHMYLAILAEQTLNEKYSAALITNNVITGIVSILLSVNSIYAYNYIKIVYSKAIGNKIAHRIVLVTVILISSYELKSLIPVFIPISLIEQNIVLILVGYYSFIELLPILAALMFLKIDRDPYDSLPDALLSSE